MSAGIGHNNGPALDRGVAWRRHAWTRARASLLPNLPIEVLRLRVARARALGLPYRTYAGVRAATGRDVIGFLFSTNALRLIRQDDVLPEDRAARLTALSGCARIALVHAPLDPARLAAVLPIDAAGPAPRFSESWSQMRDTLAGTIRAQGLPADGLLVVGDTAFESDWCLAARAAGYLSAEHYFQPVG